MLGKTSDDRLHYINADWLASRHKADYRYEEGGVGETQPFIPRAGLKERMRAAAADRREHRTPENYQALRALFLEAVEAGWSTVEIARISGYTPNGVRHSLNDDK